MRVNSNNYSEAPVARVDDVIFISVALIHFYHRKLALVAESPTHPPVNSNQGIGPVNSDRRADYAPLVEAGALCVVARPPLLHL